MTEPEGPVIPAGIADAAADWMVRRHSEDSCEIEHAFAVWLAADPRHHIAYEQVARDWRDSRLLMDSAVGQRRKLQRAPFLMRHRTQVGAAALGIATIIGLGAVGLIRQAGPFALIEPAQAALFETPIGEIRHVELGDGSQIILDTATRVRVSFTEQGRHLSLEQGRVRIRVVPDNRRPFLVTVPGGEVVANATLFDVNLTDGAARVAAIEGKVEVRAAATQQVLSAGQWNQVGAGAPPTAFPASERQWVSGMLALDATPLDHAVNAINRYNRTKLRLAEPGLGRLSVTGAFQVRSPEEFANVLAATFGLAIDRSTPGIILLKRKTTEFTAH